MTWKVCDGEGWHDAKSIDDAETMMEEFIDICRDQCDPEWPDWVGHISAYKDDAPEGLDPDEGTLVLYVQDYSVERPDGADENMEYVEYRVVSQEP